MAAKTELFDLVHTLSGTEKRHFKRWLHSSGSSSLYESYFDALCKQKVFNESALKSTFAKSASAYSNLKTYLYHNVLRALSDFRRSRSVKNSMRSQLNEVDSLVAKGLLDQALAFLDKLKIEAEAIQMLSILYQILEQRESIYARQGLSHVDSEDWDTFYLEKKNLLLDMLLVDEVRAMERSLINMNSAKGAVSRSKEFNSKIEGLIMKLPEKAGKDNAPFDAQFRYHQIKATSARMFLQHHKERVHFKAIIDLINNYPAIKVGYYSEFYAVAIHNYINACFLTSNLGTVPEMLAELDSISSEHVVLEARNFFYRFHNLTTYYKYKGEFKSVISHYLSHQKEIEEHWPHMSVAAQTHINYSVSEAHFWKGDFKRSSHFLNLIVDSPFEADNEDLLSFTRLLLVMSHAEMGDFEYLGHLITTCDRFLKKKQIRYGLEKELLKFYGQIHRQGNMPGKTDWQQLLARVEEITEDPYEKNLLHTFNVEAWVRKKLK